MPNGHDQRWEHEKELIASVEDDGWDHYPDAPDWVVEAAKSDNLHKGAGFNAKQNTYWGDNYVYLAVSSVHGAQVHVFSQLKSEYKPPDGERGHCPECQGYIKKYDEDDVLTCHRCGWEYSESDGLLGGLF